MSLISLGVAMAIIEEVVENSDIIENVEKVKQEGNASFGQGEWSAAAEKYKEALNICPPENDSLRSVLLSNLSAAYIKQTQWEAAAEVATQAIEVSYFLRIPECIDSFEGPTHQYYTKTC
ncbi:tetratricopeptide repeat protein [Ancylostoma caninum]|uniref:Tetratricopeptide repeat protein n=1 Tax=Ancylostoma caninum TaxID=29170 RepID=A0A368EX44_ANCCA|nr:tetratricopeptide repeat protein [Ancylostoma caninum]